MKELTTAQVGEMLEISADRVRWHARQGDIKGRRFGGAWAFTLKAVEDYKQRRRGPGRPRREEEVA